MKAIMLDSEYRSTGIFDFEPTNDFISFTPIIVGDDEVIKKLNAKFKPSKKQITPELITKINNLINSDDLVEAAELMQANFGVKHCCKPLMQDYMSKIKL